jgi:hypothetical protein
MRQCLCKRNEGRVEVSSLLQIKLCGAGREAWDHRETGYISCAARTNGKKDTTLLELRSRFPTSPHYFDIHPPSFTWYHQPQQPHKTR